MARYKLQGIARDGAGNIIADASVSVYLAGTTTAASVYEASSGGTAVNSVDTDDEGFYELYVDSIDYPLSQNFKITISKSGYTSKTFDEIDIFPGLPDYEIDVSSIYGNSSKNATILNTAITAVGTIDKMIFVLYPGVWTIDTDVTVPSNITLKIPSGALLQISTGITLTIDGPFEAGLYQVFSCTGTGKVLFGAGSVTYVRPEWFGAVGDTVLTNGAFTSGTDSTTAIQQAVVASQSIHKVLLGNGVFKVTDSIVETTNTASATYNGFWLKGNGWKTVLVNVAAAITPTVSLDTYGGRISDLCITGVQANPNSSIKISGTAIDVLLENVALDPMGHGIEVDATNVQTLRLRNVQIWWNVYGWGTTAIRTLSNTNNYDGIHITGVNFNQIDIDGLRIEGGRYGIYALQTILGNSKGFRLNNYVNTGTNRGIYLDSIENVDVSNWYLSNSATGDYAGYFNNCRFLKLKNVTSDSGGVLNATKSLGFFGASTSAISMDTIYNDGNIELDTLLPTQLRLFLSNVILLYGAFTDKQPYEFTDYLGNGVYASGSSAGGQQIVKGRFSNPFQELRDDVTTPNVARGNNFRFVYSSGITVTNFLGGLNGQEITLMTSPSGTGYDVTIDNNSDIVLGAADIIIRDKDVLTLVNRDGVWYKKSWEDNTP